MKRLSPAKRILFVVVAVVIGLMVVEGFLSFIWTFREYSAYKENLPLAVMTPASVHATHDSELGWKNIPGGQFRDLYGPGRSISINDEGFRGFENYIGQKPNDRHRVVCVGDSFTFGYGVDDKDSFSAQLQQANKNFQVVNMGMSGYSVGQCYLRYQREIEKLEADVVVYALIVDDILRMKSGRVINGYAVPSFEFVAGRIVVSGQPVPPKVETGQRMGDIQFWTFLSQSNSICRTFASFSPPEAPQIDAQEEGFRQLEVAMAMIRMMNADAKRRNVRFVLLLLPELEELTVPARNETYLGVTGDFQRMAADENIQVLDLYPQFTNAGPAEIDQLYLPERWHHFSERGNHLVAEQLNELLSRMLK